MKPIGARDIREAKRELRILTECYLRARGWKYICTTPGAYWLWEKALDDGRVFLLNTDGAMGIQEAIDAPEDDEDESQ